MGYVPLQEETQVIAVSHVGIQEEGSCLQARTQALSRSAGALILEFPASSSMKISVCCLSHSVYRIFLLQQPELRQRAHMKLKLPMLILLALKF